MQTRVNIQGSKKMKKQLADSTIYGAFSVGSRASQHGTDAEYLENFVTEINSLIEKPKKAFLFIATELQEFNFDQFIVFLNRPEEDPVNRCSVLSEEELFHAFKALESNPILNKIPAEEKISPDLAGELFAKIFKPIAQKVGNRVTESLTPIWRKLETKTVRNETMQVGELSIGDVIKKYDVEKDWDNNGEKYNKFQRTFEIIKKEYTNNEVEKKEFDVAVEEIFATRKFVEAGERLKVFFRNPAYYVKFENKSLLKFIDAIVNYLDFEKIGKKQIFMYLFTELALLRSEPKDTFYLYPHSPHKRLQNYYKRHKIPLVLINMFRMQPKVKLEQEKISIKEQKKFDLEKTSAILPNLIPSMVPEIPRSVFLPKNEIPSLEAKYSVESYDNQKSPIDKRKYDDFRCDSLEEKRGAKVFSPFALRKSPHNLPSLNIPSTFFPPPPALTPSTVRKVGSVKMDLLMLIMVLEKHEGAAQSLLLAEDKLESILAQVKLLNSNISELSQQNNVTYSPRTIVR